MERKPKKQDETLTALRLRQLLSYDPDTGAFTWRVWRSYRAPAGAPAGYGAAGQHTKVLVDGKSYKAHRLAWLYTTGSWPDDEIDHINGVRDDNRLCNLRECLREQNMQNKSVYRNNTSGFPGVTWHAPNQAWVARISRNGRKHCLGYFKEPSAAFDAYVRAKGKLHTFNPTVRIS